MNTNNFTQKQKATLSELRQKANFASANFDGIGDRLRMETVGNSTFVIETKDVYDSEKRTWETKTFRRSITEFILERTRLYRDSWVNSLFDDLNVAP